MSAPMPSPMDARCEECELEAARMAYAAELGASEWPAFIDRVPRCAACEQVAVLRGGWRTKAEEHRMMARAAIRVALRHGIKDTEIEQEYEIVRAQELEARR